MSDEGKKAIEYYKNNECSFKCDFDTEKLLKISGITEEDSFENHQIRFKTLINLIEKQKKEIEDLKVKNNMKIIGNIDTIKIEDLEDIIEPYYIPKSKIREKIEEIDNMIKETGKGKLQKYTVGELIIIRLYLEQEILEEKE